MEQLDPLLTTDALGRLNDLDVPLLGEGVEEALVVGGDGP
jgi:hypothetical protein